MNAGSPCAHLPEVVIVTTAASCRCGEPIAPGERVGHTPADGGVLCLWCMADLQTGRASLEIRARDTSPGTRTDATLWPSAQALQVAYRADQLVNRMAAARALGTLSGELQPLEAFGRC